MTFLGVRFLVELALVAAPVLVGVRWLGGVAGVAVGLVGSAAVATVWGLALSPKRRLNARLLVRVALELALIGAAAAGLALVGYGTWAAALVAGELVSVLVLAALGLPPGSDVGRASAADATEARR